MAGALVDQRHEALGTLAEGRVQRVARRLEGLGEVATRLDDGAGNALADHVEVEDEAGMALGDGLAHALGIGNDRFALAGQFLDEGAHARLIVGIGALEGGDLVVDHHFELAGAAEGTLEAVAQRVHFAADGLADRGNLLGGGGFGLGEPDGGLRHRGGGVTQFLGAADQGGDGEKAENRDDGEGDQADEVVRAIKARIA